VFAGIDSKSAFNPVDHLEFIPDRLNPIRAAERHIVRFIAS
jgi:hypothetical protein